MSKFLVVTFPEEASASEGTRALKDLDAEGSLTLYGLAVVGMDPEGTLSIREAADGGPLGTAAGALADGLIGLLGGPGGAAEGAGGSPLLGSLRALFRLGVNESFLDAVSRQLAIGQTAIVAEVEEDRITPLDTRVEAIGGSVARTWRADVEDEVYAREVNARRAELADLKAEFAQGRTETRAKLKARLDDTQASLQDAADQANAWIERRRQETEARINALRAQAAEASGDARAKLDRRALELHVECDRGSARLKQALALTREAGLTPLVDRHTEHYRPKLHPCGCSQETNP